jgi:YebC/PmpR family DNA-binding regulatory protein
MAGHSKWANIKHRKGRQDEKRGKLFGKIIKEITVAARMGGGDQDSNPRLRRVLAKAYSNNMNKDTVERAIKKGTGELEGVEYEEVTYGGYAPGGVALLLNCVTDNRNRTTPEIRHLFAKYGGNLAETSAVTHLFERKGYILVPVEGNDEESLMEVVLEAGAEDMSRDGDNFEIISSTEDYEAVAAALEKAQIDTIESQVSMIPTMTIKVEGKEAEQVLNLMELFDDHDDVQDIWANFDIDDAEVSN